MPRFFLGIHEAHADPAVALVADGKLLACSEEERHTRHKHAFGVYPHRALEWCLSQAGIALDDVELVGINWDLDAYTNGEMRAFYDSVNAAFETDANTLAWQASTLTRYNAARQVDHHRFHWRRSFGDCRFPRLASYPHHFTHAFHAATQSGRERSIVVTVDGSGDRDCTVVWRHEGTELRRVYEVPIPHSLGWFYAAMTEYLGFEAYDGEYKVMGLAAYGGANARLRERIRCVLQCSSDGIGYRLDPRYIHRGAHSYSMRFTDALPALLGRAPRLTHEPLDDWHRDLAYEVQAALEASVLRLVSWAVAETDVLDVCVSGGVAHNVKMNTRLLDVPGVRSVFPQPLCADSGAAAGAALLACFRATGIAPAPLTSLALGPDLDDREIEEALQTTKCAYEQPAHLTREVARALADGCVVAWCQGRAEAGPRALGQRSILADPRVVSSRDRVNAVIKHREPWRPFCPSMKAESAARYLARYCDAPFMTLAFPATELARAEMPAVVHADGTVRVQLVDAAVCPLYDELLTEFERLTGVPALLNTSFNVKGEPIVSSVHDALRTFWSTGLDVLAIGRFLIRKPRA